jgi:hypothetical protein
MFLAVIPATIGIGSCMRNFSQEARMTEEELMADHDSLEPERRLLYKLFPGLEEVSKKCRADLLRNRLRTGWKPLHPPEYYFRSSPSNPQSGPCSAKDSPESSKED